MSNIGPLGRATDGHLMSTIVEALFPEHDSVSATHDFCDEYATDLEFERIYSLTDSLRRGQYGLSESQYDSLVTAYQDGSYRVPREETLQELSDELDVSHPSLSERLRRGHDHRDHADSRAVVAVRRL